METLEGHRRPSGGRVSLLGMDPYRQRRTLRSRVGIMVQESGFVGDLTVAETVRLWRSLSSHTEDPAEKLEQLDLLHRKDVAVKQLSGGERRRLDLAMALFGNPEVLFLDEPTTGLDPESRKRTWDVIRELLAGGATVLLTTHYLEEAEELADRLAIMHAGRIAVSGTMEEVLAREPSRIRFDLPPGVDPSTLPNPANGTEKRVDVTDGGIVHVSIRTRCLQHDLTQLLQWAQARSVELARLQAKEASLEEIFHHVRSDGNGLDSHVTKGVAR